MSLEAKRGTLAARFHVNKITGRGQGLRAAVLSAWLGCALVVGGALVALPATAQAEIGTADAQIYRDAIAAAEAGRFAEARQIAARAKQDLPQKVIRWMELTDPRGGASWPDLTEFLEKNPGWPNLAAIRRNAEAAMPDMPSAAVRAWFDKYPPLTTIGFTRHIDALMDARESDRAIALVRQRYVSGSFGAVEEKDFRRRFNSLLRPQDHWARLDRLLWDGDDAGAKRMMPLVDKGRQQVAIARMALSNGGGGAEGALRKVPPSLLDDSGLQFERLRFRRIKDNDTGALEILAKAPKDLGRPDAWWQERHIMARRLIERRDYRQAYQLVNGHGTKEGQSFAQAEFLAGWLALRYLNRPADALKHFETLYRGVASPLSKSRGAYWAGRAAAALGDKERAGTWYETAMSLGSTFYGMLAAEEMGRKPGSILKRSEPPSDAKLAEYGKRDLVRIVRMLDRIEGSEARLTAMFIRRLAADADTDADFQLLGAVVAKLGRPELGVVVSRQALQDGSLVFEAGYPLLSTDLPVRPEPALVHAIIRQESNFSTTAVSSAGARGLMQLMPATAQQTAKRIGLTHTHVKLTAEPGYNVRVGTAYLQDLIDRFDGSYVLAVASYNAGPGRVTAWLRTFGDPRNPAVDTVDWIESIPIYETRNYVQRVLENMHIYRARLSEDPLPLTMDLRRGGPAGAG